MTADYEKAAAKAAETLIKYHVKSAPVDPLPILKSLPGVLVMSYEEVSNDVDMDRDCVISTFGKGNLDSFCTVNKKDGKLQYLVTYNQRLPFVLTQRSLARELGHIVLGHDGSLPEDVRNEEAKCFAHHLLCPRPMLFSLLETRIRFTVEVLGNLTGCYDYCLTCMRKLPGVHVPAEMNRKIRDQFMPYMLSFFEFQRIATRKDVSAVADFGTYMDGYEE
jgi:hypothetical protein